MAGNFFYGQKNDMNYGVNESKTYSEHPDKRLSFSESIREQPYIYIVWLVMIVLVMSTYYLVIGFNTKITLILGIVLFLILIVNMFLSAVDSYDSFELELDDYSYVESNARAFLPFGVALAALVVAANRNSDFILSPKFMGALLLATCCFVLVLTIIWMPKDSGRGIRFYRDIKTAILALGGVTIVALVAEFGFSHFSKEQ